MKEPTKPWELVRRLLWIALAVILIAVVAVLGISGFAAYSMTKVARVPVTQTPADLGMTYENISFQSRDNLALRGWWLDGNSEDKVIIMLHGSDGNRADPSIKMLEIASSLVQQGYNVVMFDLRGHGESDGVRVSAGYFEKNDLLGAISYVKQQGMNKIGVLGFSMGGATALMTAAESSDIAAVVSDSSYADLEEIIDYQFSVRSPLPRFFIPLILFMNRTLYGIDFPAVKPIEAVNKTDCPVFIISGGKDDTVTEEQSRRMYQASSNPQSQLWFVPEAEHVKSYSSRPVEYISKVTTFFDAAMR